MCLERRPPCAPASRVGLEAGSPGFRPGNRRRAGVGGAPRASRAAHRRPVGARASEGRLPRVLRIAVPRHSRGSGNPGCPPRKGPPRIGTPPEARWLGAGRFGTRVRGSLAAMDFSMRLPSVPVTRGARALYPGEAVVASQVCFSPRASPCPGPTTPSPSSAAVRKRSSWRRTSWRSSSAVRRCASRPASIPPRRTSISDTPCCSTRCGSFSSSATK